MMQGILFAIYLRLYHHPKNSKYYECSRFKNQELS
jgi:hypothetical protein